jgi:hypothetical protein
MLAARKPDKSSTKEDMGSGRRRAESPLVSPRGRTTEMNRTHRTNPLRRVSARTRSLAADERGDVPGWVLITLMTAGLVIIIWGLAGPALSGVFQQAIERVTSF